MAAGYYISELSVLHKRDLYNGIVKFKSAGIVAVKSST